MQKVLATILAVPILVLVYAGTAVRRTSRRHAVMAFVALGLTGVLIATALRPTPATGTLPARVSAVDPAEFTPIVESGASPSAPVLISFPEAMNTASVERLVRIEPATALTFSWDDTATQLTITPRGSWALGTIHTVTVEAGALDATGRPLDRQVRSAFVTREAMTATIAATAMTAGTTLAASHIHVAFSGPVRAASVALVTDPVIAGRIGVASDSTPARPAFEFIPDDPLPGGTTFTISLGAGVQDVDGGTVTAEAATIKTAAPPSVVRFRPANGATGVGWTQNLSVRFTEPMDQASTEAAWSVTQGGVAVAGSFTWAEGDTVLVFNPTKSLGYSQKITLAVAVGATSKAGLPLASVRSATFTTAARTAPGTKTTTGGGGGAIGSSTWSAVEAYYLKLMNCTRTGGIVTSSGSCSSPGGRNVAALWQDAGITTKVSRPYAKKLAVNNLCTHFSGGTPGDRLKAQGFTSYVWAENLGCRSGDPYAAVLGSHLFFQSEASYSGGHYVNLMNAKYDRVGIGVWVSGGRVRLVIDFYHPL
ncbi:MAG: Ig-like domain-containing protein [Chloroflexota bacterium]